MRSDLSFLRPLSRAKPFAVVVGVALIGVGCTNAITWNAELNDEFGDFKATGGQCVDITPTPEGEVSPLLEADRYDFLVYGGVLGEVVAPSGNVRYDDVLSRVELSEGARLTVAQIANVDPRRLETSAEKLAFWINAYNALVLRSAAINFDADPTFQVDENNAAFFDQRTHVVGGEIYSLNLIEHGVLRGTQFHSSTATLPDEEWQAVLALHNDLWAGDEIDVRFHFAINCASRSCPVLLPGAFRAETLDATLDAASEAFVLDAERGANGEGISQIFDFYYDDFERVGGAEAFIAQYRETASLNLNRFLFYDWALNLATD